MDQLAPTVYISSVFPMRPLPPGKKHYQDWPKANEKLMSDARGVEVRSLEPQQVLDALGVNRAASSRGRQHHLKIARRFQSLAVRYKGKHRSRDVPQTNTGT